jgi:hypothetical protein
LSRNQRAFDVRRFEVLTGTKSKVMVVREDGAAYIIDFNTANVFIAGRASGVATIEEVCRLVVEHKCNVDLLLDDTERHKVVVAGFAAVE